MDQTLPNLTDEEKLYPNGMKHLMIVPSSGIKRRYGSDYRTIPKEFQHGVEQEELRKLAYILEQEGIDYPPELPELDDENKHALTEEWISAHRSKPDEAESEYKRNRASNINCSWNEIEGFILRYGG